MADNGVPGLDRYERQEAEAAHREEHPVIVRVGASAWQDMSGGQWGQDATSAHRQGKGPEGYADPDVVRAFMEATWSGQRTMLVPVRTAEVAYSLEVLAEALSHGARDSGEHSLARSLATVAERMAAARAELDPPEAE